MEYDEEEYEEVKEEFDYTNVGFDKKGAMVGFARDDDPFVRMLSGFLDKNYNRIKRQHSQIINIAKTIPNRENLVPGMLVSAILFITNVTANLSNVDKYDKLTPEIFDAYSDDALKVLLDKELKDKLIGTLTREQIVKIVKGDLLRYLKFIMK